MDLAPRPMGTSGGHARVLALRAPPGHTGPMNAARLLLPFFAVLAACTTAPPGPAPAAPAPSSMPWFGDFATTYRCGDTGQQAAVAFDGDTMVLRVGAATVPLKPVVAASGAKYEGDGNPSTVVWTKGSTARITWQGETWPECVAALSGAQALRADGKGWQLDLYGPRVSLRAPDGQPLAEGRTAGPRQIGNSITYNALTARGMLVVTALERICPGPQPRPLTVQVAWEGRVLDGCGGETAALLQSGVWVVEDLGGAGVIDNSRITLNFAPDGHVAGRASCNQYTGTYQLTADGITFVRTATTMMACAPALMHQEDRFLKALQATRRIDVQPDGALILVAADGSRTKARRE